ncbi:MAG: glucose-1-phosphate adenylyltransferase [Holophagaceae bacterium]
MQLESTPLSPRQTITVVLAGGRGTRLEGLTERSSKPGLDFGGQFKIIDFALSNCVNSGFRRVMVLTQYSAHSLLEHLQLGWGFLSGHLNEFIQAYPAEQRRERESWYQGTADAVYQNLPSIMAHRPRNVLVLAGDHVYRMDYKAFLRDHLQAEADLSIACLEVPRAEASSFGVLAVDGSDRVTAFVEKPAEPPGLPGAPDRSLASMGIYFFNAGFLYDLLKRDAADPDSRHDFGADLIPSALARGARIFAHRFERSAVRSLPGGPYWRDVGTLDAFWDANMDLTAPEPKLDLFDADWPIFTHLEPLPPARLVRSHVDPSPSGHESVVGPGCLVEGAHLEGSLLSSRVRVHAGTRVEDSVVLPDVEIGAGCRFRRTLLARGCRIPDGTVVGEDPAEDARRFHVTAGGIALVTPRLLQRNVG